MTRAPHFTRRRSGAELATVHLEVNITREEYEVLRQLSANGDWRATLEHPLIDFVQMQMYDQLAEKQRDEGI